jgi:hypothetical protein
MLPSSQDYTPMSELSGPTEESIRASIEACIAERQAAVDKSNGTLRISANGHVELAPDSEIERLRVMAKHVFQRVRVPIAERCLSRAQTEDLQDRIDLLIEDFTLAAVDRAVRLAKAANGLED